MMVDYKKKQMMMMVEKIMIIFRCEGTPCGFGDERYDGVCDKDGCDLNPWRLFYNHEGLSNIHIS